MSHNTSDIIVYVYVFPEVPPIVPGTRISLLSGIKGTNEFVLPHPNGTPCVVFRIKKTSFAVHLLSSFFICSEAFNAPVYLSGFTMCGFLLELIFAL